MIKLLRRPGWFGWIFIVFALSLVVLSIDWRPKHPATPPKIEQAFSVRGALSAGAAKVEIVPPFPTPIGGFANRGNDPFEGVLDAPHARALVVEAGGRKLAFASIELVVLPAALRDKVVAKLADLKLNDVVIAATHSHASVGGYWHSTLASWLGLGSYQPKVEAFLVDRIAQAIREAATKVQPARVSVGRIEASNYGMNRDVKGGVVDRQLTGVRFTSVDGENLAQLIVFSVHPTILSPESMNLSAEWPGAMSASLEADGGVALFFQGDVGDTTWAKRQGGMTREERMVLFGQAIASDARGAIAAGGEGVADVELAHARARFALPPCDASGAVPRFLAPMASNFLEWAAQPESAEVSFTRIGPLALAAVPGEITAELGLDWQPRLHATVVGLADAYVGYVDVPATIVARKGEAQRSYFGPTLATRLFDALTAAKAAAR